MTGLSGLIAACGIVAHADLLDAIVRVESGGNPIALRVNGAVELVRVPRDLDDAAAMARWLATHGYSFDAGLAQVNSANLARLGLDTSSVFEPCANLRAASRLLEECYERALQRWDDMERAMTAALSCYNTGHFTHGVRNGYVSSVRAASSLAPQSIATDSAKTKAARRRDAPRPAGRRSGAVDRGQRIGNAQPRDEVFAMAPAEVFDASSSEKTAR
ncbi:lytic transglycosylase domain-containing protein [Anaeromyxobacter sp. PSR-1]|uniref:lytic transglycosylase domain-containing protein n=1 Tax=Anaeromyxobacter sp. PSR-1 TaxID=1300915 RepID=UPI0005E7E136|nr:lytic transglycosylase domain-containing protein [Anaeromyxobacter sp. PSR-1]GAO01291.1 type IV secretion system protein virB1 [Anaeromyxobacter sp. PSR-1]